MQAQESVFYEPPIRKNRILVPGIILIVAIVLVVAWLLWQRWRALEASKNEPQVECRTSKDCDIGEICSSINTCEVFLAPVQ